MTYSNCTQIAKGVFVCNEATAVYIRDNRGEVVMWTYDEVAEDPMCWVATLNAVAIAATDGPGAIREFMADE